ncbi:hypothetical protein EUGRSUZ_H02648 [Eucalyptus grandis]|uniref:Uncharacterized protein n=2 Tax=Eucalyptus grandis TaxID=71139 RepID=A0ACC3JSJ5_EUCGR|nr:hypothetical protein EUGRSUZ_H02648 [Eucalyptus grandis]
MCALGLISRNLPLPPDLLNAVSSICDDAAAGGGDGDGEDGAGGGSEEISVAVEKGPVRVFFSPLQSGSRSPMGILRRFAFGFGVFEEIARSLSVALSLALCTPLI